MIAKPFLKWAGGKSKILNNIVNVLPPDFEKKKMTYIEPFLGGGSIFFGLSQKFNNFDRIILNDINNDLVNCYLVIKNQVSELKDILYFFQNEYHRFSCEDKKKEYY